MTDEEADYILALLVGAAIAALAWYLRRGQSDTAGALVSAGGASAGAAQAQPHPQATNPQAAPTAAQSPLSGTAGSSAPDVCAAAVPSATSFPSATASAAHSSARSSRGRGDVPFLSVGVTSPSQLASIPLDRLSTRFRIVVVATLAAVSSSSSSTPAAGKQSPEAAAAKRAGEARFRAEALQLHPYLGEHRFVFVASAAGRRACARDMNGCHVDVDSAVVSELQGKVALGVAAVGATANWEDVAAKGSKVA